MLLQKDFLILKPLDKFRNSQKKNNYAKIASAAIIIAIYCDDDNKRQ